MFQGVRAIRQTLAPGDVHVWHLLTEQIADPELLHSWEASLPAEERAGHQRYAQPRDRLHFLLSRVMLRTVLASCLNVPPAKIEYTTNAFGKPVVKGADSLRVHFNLSHSHGAIVCAVSRDREVGVDVEDWSRPVQYLDLAERYFEAREFAHLTRLERERLPAAFFAIWTLKEAFVKAIGQGLTFPLDSFAFLLDEDRLTGFCPPPSCGANDWQCIQFELGRRHRGALVARNDPAGEANARLQEWAGTFLP